MLNRIAAYARRNVIALLALFIALGSGSAVAASYISGAQIKPHSIPANRLTVSALKALGGQSAYTDSSGGTPPAGGKLSVIRQVQITTTKPGKILVLDSVLRDITYNNTSLAPVHYSLGVYVDGVPVPGTSLSGFIAPAGASAILGVNSPLYGSLSNVAPGTHTVALAASTTDKAANSVVSGTGRLIVLATG